MNRHIWQLQIQARKEREKKLEEEDKYAPVGSPEDYAKSHATSFLATNGSSTTNRSKGRMLKFKEQFQNPHILNFPKYYEFQDEQPLYPYPLEDAHRSLS
jgi:hypothetical protein